MDWAQLMAAAGAGIATAGGAIYYTFRKMRREFAADGAERFANDWHQKVIARQDQEAARQREEIHVLRETVTQTTRRLLEVEMRERVKERVIRDIIKDIRLVKKDELPIESLNTSLLDDL